MNERLNWMFPSISVGRIFSTDVRISVWFALVPFVIIPRCGLEVGLTFTVVLCLSVLAHEFAHVFATRSTGGNCDEIHLSPFGGLATARPGRGAFGLAMTAAAGPFANLLVCIATFPGWYAKDTLWGVLNPFVLQVSQFHAESAWRELGLIIFAANWILLLVNLLPVMPLDGGQILRAILSTKIHPELVHRTAMHVGLAVSVVLLIVGAAADMSQIVLVGTFILLINVVQLMQEEMGESLDDSGFGYDFSGSYESLDSSNQTATRQAPPGLLQRWRERRRVRREQQERIRRMEAEQQLDSLLAKVHETGLKSLSEQEQKLLKSCSELLRGRQKGDG
ncbi:metalloprotease [Schlesneria paludicola]|uniref:metalloprotease n=1 Tax=Schlesneria paludicola TaxID=360056 RepID=UPI00029ADA19|nr:M50 family metallopeptidase [Schlesneria paludicola]